MGESYAVLARPRGGADMTPAPDLAELMGRYREAQLSPPDAESLARLNAVAMVAIMGELLRHSADTAAIKARLDALHERAPTKDELAQWRADLRSEGWWSEAGRKALRLLAVVAAVAAGLAGLKYVATELQGFAEHVGRPRR